MERSYEQHARASNTIEEYFASVGADKTKNPNRDAVEFLKAWTDKKGINLGSSSSKSNAPSSNVEKGKSYETPQGVSSMMTQIEKFLVAQESRYIPGIEEQASSAKDLFDILFNSQKQFNYLSTIGEEIIKRSLGKLELFAKQQSGLLKVINEDAGLTGDYARDFNAALTDASPRLIQLGIGFDYLANAAAQSIDESGKFATLNRETWERAGEIAKSYVGDLTRLVAMYPEFAKVGIGAATAQERIAKAGKDAISVGLQAQKVTKDISANLGRLNEYGFKNGVDGLSAMVRKSIEFKTSMDSVFAVAEKVFSPEGAIELSANLQVLGGAIGDFNDPLKLMYMATNNVEGLQDALVGAAGSLATYNQQQGRFEVTGANLRRAKEMASALGISMKELNTTAIAAAERTQASTALMARGFVLDEKQKAFLTNIAQMKEGRMVIELGASPDLVKKFGKSEVAIEELSQNQLSTILTYQEELKKLSEEEIVRKQATDIKNIERNVDAITQRLANTGGRIMKGISEETFKQTTGVSTKDMVQMTGDMATKFNKSIEGFEYKFVNGFKDGIQDLEKWSTKFFSGFKQTFGLEKEGEKKETKPAGIGAASKEAEANNAKAYQDNSMNLQKTTADNTTALVQQNQQKLNQPIVVNNNVNAADIAKKESEKQTQTTGIQPNDFASLILTSFQQLSSNFSISNITSQNISIQNYKELYDLILKNIELSQSSIASYGSFIENKKTENIKSFTPIKTNENETNIYARNANMIENQNMTFNKLGDYLSNINKKPETTESPKESVVKEVKITHIHEFRAQNGVIDPVVRAIMNSPDFTSLFVGSKEFTSPAIKNAYAIEG